MPRAADHSERRDEFGRAALAIISRDGPVGPLVHEAVLRLLPLDEDRIGNVRVRLAFIAAGANDARHAAHQAVRQELLDQLLIAAIERAKATGEADPSVGAHIAAIVIASLVNGLASQMITDPKRIPPSVAVTAIRAHLATVFIDSDFADY